MIQLAQSTGIAHVDDLLVSYLTQVSECFAGRLRSVYLVGSVANATPDHLSDIDGFMILDGRPTVEDQRTFTSITSASSARGNTLLDFVLFGDDDLFARGALPRKAASWILLYGEEIRDRVPPMSVDQYIDAIMRGSFGCLKHTRGAPDRLAFPLTYPDPDGEFFGYERNGFREFDGWRSPGTKALVNGLSLAATTVVAIRTGYCATSRREGFAVYRERIGGRWAPFLHEIHELCRDAWSYHVPADADDRLRLRRLCHEVLDFENEYLGTCIRYFRSRLESELDGVAARAAETLALIDYVPSAVPSSA